MSKRDGRRRRTRQAALFAITLATAVDAAALYDPTKEYIETSAVAARYADPNVDIATPAFRAG